MLGEGTAPHATVMFEGGVLNTGKAAGLTVIVLETDDSALPHASVAVQVCVTVPPQGPGVAVKVDGLDVPLIKHPPANPLVNVIVLAAGKAPQATVMLAGAVMVGSAAGLTVIVLETEAKALPHASVAAHVSVIVPPQGPGVTDKVDVAVPLIRQLPVKPFE